MAAPLKRVEVARVLMWGKEVGAVLWNASRGLASFEYEESFLRQRLEIAPLTVPLRKSIFSFPELDPKTFYGLPGLLSDSLPDSFGHALIRLWLAQHGRELNDFSPVERLCYIGSRGMGALEFKPAYEPRQGKAAPIEVSELTELVSRILSDRANLNVNLGHEADAVRAILRIGTSAGGARPKAIIAWNPSTNAVRSGQVPPPKGFEPWIIKLDGVRNNALGDPAGYGRIEYAYHRMASAAGIRMMECRLFEEGGRAHFMTRRFDRERDGQKIHRLSLCGLAHLDFRAKGAYGYEDVLSVIQRLNLGYPTVEEMYRRMVFNVLARNQDDHTRNIEFVMSPDGRWALAPAFDLIWAYQPGGEWTSVHQLRMNGKQDGFERSDLLEVARQFGIKAADDIIQEAGEAVRRWPEFAEETGVDPNFISQIGGTHRLHLVSEKKLP
jgi:serine/threonine-protein kinase HipA